MMQRPHRKPQAPAGRDRRCGRTAAAAAPTPARRKVEQAPRKQTSSQDDSAACVFAELARLSAGQLSKQEMEMCFASMCSLFVAATAEPEEVVRTRAKSACGLADEAEAGGIEASRNASSEASGFR